MQYVIAIAAVVPIRSDASHKAEMVSQLLLGEAAEVFEAKADFTKIRCLYDGYEGWCANSQLAPVENIDSVKPVTYTITRSAAALLNGTNVPLSLATPVFSRIAAGNFVIEFIEENIPIGIIEEDNRDAFIKQFTYRYLNTPYLWGGKSSAGIDCSGFTQQVFKVLGIPLLRDAYQQATQGELISNLDEAKCGDLAFFDNTEGRITHVGILLDNSTIIHASGYVRIDTIDNSGITHSITGAKTHKLKLVKRMGAATC
ncbi:MAG TPA: C40 family peptidase [Chitinophagaceae bacterium]|nr:C40 family peptidase [Chitinophagaceae bacterium]